MKNKNGTEGLLWIIIILPILYLMAVYGSLPATIPVHFDASGTPDDYGDKSVLWVMLLGIQLLVYLIMKIAPKIDPKKNFKKFESSFQKLRLILQLFIALVCIVLIKSAEGSLENTAYGITFSIALLIIMLGNHLQNIKPNYFLGIRTPWTLENEQVWTLTHRITGRLWFFGGIITFIALFFIPVSYAIPLVVGVTTAGAVYGFVYSYLIHKKLTNSNN